MWQLSPKRNALFALAMVGSLIFAACAGGVSKKDLDAAKQQLKQKETELAQLRALAERQGLQLPPATGQLPEVVTEYMKKEGQVAGVVEAGQLVAAPARPQPTGWDTEWSQMLGIALMAQLDSNGPPVWQPKDHPLVFVTSEGPGYGSAQFGRGGRGMREWQ